MIAGGLRAALRILAAAWRRAWAVLTLTAVLAAVAAHHRLDAPSHDALDLWFAAAALSALVARGALWRIAMDMPGVGPGGLQLGRPEARLFLVGALSALFLFVIGLLFFVVVLGFAYAAASAGHGFVASNISTWAPAVDARGRLMVTLVGLAAAGLLIWIALRISLAEAATMAEGRVMVLESWPRTRDRVTAIVVANLVIALPPAAVLALTVMIGDGWACCAVDGPVLGGLWLPMQVGLMAYFHERRASPPVL